MIAEAQWYRTSNKCAVASIQKCGTVSMNKFFPNCRTGAEHILDLPLRIAFIRHPWKRLISAYQMFRGDGTGDFIPWESRQSWKGFVDYALEHENVHWHSQKILLTFKGQFIPNKLERFEDISWRWQDYFGKALPHEHISNPLVVTAYRKADILKHYEEDLELWENIDSSSGLWYKEKIVS